MPVTHCQTVSEAVGSDGTCVQRNTFWPPVHETPAVVAQNQGVFPQGKSAPHDQGQAMMPSCLSYVEKTLVSFPRTCAGGSLSSRHANDGCIPHEWSLGLRSVAGPSSLVAHKLPGNAGSLYKLAHHILLWAQGEGRKYIYSQLKRGHTVHCGSPSLSQLLLFWMLW
jgi:hypothetical protein